MGAQPNVSPRVHRLGSSTVNWYLVEENGRFMAVDAGMPGFKRSLKADLAAVGASVGDIEALILTHPDADHIGLARVLQHAGGRVLIHRDDQAALRKPRAKSGDAAPINTLRELWRPSFWAFIVRFMASAGRIHGIEGAQTFEHGDTLDVPGHPRVVPTPGHTAGHCAFHFPDHGALFVGDAMCTLSPVTGKRGPQLMPRPMNESNARALESLGSLEPIEVDIMLFGHGDPWRGGVGAGVAEARAVYRA